MVRRTRLDVNVVRTLLVLLGAFSKIAKSVSASSCLSACNDSAPPGRIFMKFDTCFSKKKVRKIQVSLNSDKNNGYFT